MAGFSLSLRSCDQSMRKPLSSLVSSSGTLLPTSLLLYA
jgi:hypothetical protein